MRVNTQVTCAVLATDPTDIQLTSFLAVRARLKAVSILNLALKFGY
jgi:hypothetical protein